MCTCGCNLPIEVAHDPEQAFKVDTFKCAAGRAIARRRREVEEQHKNDADDSWADGVFFYAEPVEVDTAAPPPTSRLEAIKAGRQR